MSSFENKAKKATRIHNDQVAIKKQLKIAKAHGMGLNDKLISEPHRLTKHHAMDCGNADCHICGNPRKTQKDKLTAQEKRIFQDLDKITDKHSNGLPHDNGSESEE